MKKLLFVFIAAFMLVAGTAQCALKTFTELMGQEAFAKASAEERLLLLQKQMDDKEIKSGELSGDLMTLLFNDKLKDEKDPAAKLEVYGTIRNKCMKLPATYELELHLVTSFLATTPEGQKGDLVGMMKHIQTLLDAKKTCWPVVAPLHEGMLAAHLVANAEYQKMSAKDKIGYLKKLLGEVVIKEMSSNRFARGVVGDLLISLPQEERKAAYDELVPLLDTFTKIAVTNSFFK